MDDGNILAYSLPFVRTACPVFTYYQPVSNADDPLLIQVLDIWGYAFYAQGFRPIILNRTHAEKRVNFTEISKKFSRFPTVNPPEYELSCYLRWIALAEQGGGLLMDYDILPMTSSRSEDMRKLRECKWGDLTTYSSMSPMITHGNASEIEKWVNYMANFQLKDVTTIQRRPHISDMMMAVHAINHNQNIFAVKSALPFFHYSYYAIHNMFRYIKHNVAELMNRNQHVYYLLHHDIYVPISTFVAPYSEKIVRSLTLCPGNMPTFDDLDSLCTSRKTVSDICKLITINGSWSPDDPTTGKCTWNTKPPDSESEWGILESAVRQREPFVIAILPRPEIYRWRLWSSEHFLISKTSSNRTHEFLVWTLHQSSSLMLNTLIPTVTDKMNVDARITRTINAMRSGQALLMTEAFFVQLYQSEGKEGVEEWISAHLGFFLNIEQLNINWKREPVIDMDLKLFSDDKRFYFAIHKENERWTEDWNNWRNTFLPVRSERLKIS